MKAGARNRKIFIERAVLETNDYGEAIETWGPYASPFAQIVFGNGAERREAAQESASAPATFRVLHTSETAAVTPRDRIYYGGYTWDIISNVPSLKFNREREITAVTAYQIVDLRLEGAVSGLGTLEGAISVEARLLASSSLVSISSASGLVVEARLTGSSSGAGAASATITNFSPALLFTGGFTGGWYDPSDLTSMFQDTAGTTPATVGNVVKRINDKSGNGLHATNATTGPILRQDGSGRYYLEFNGTDQFLSVAYVQSAYPLTLMAVGRATAGGGLLSVEIGAASYKQLQSTTTTTVQAQDRNASTINAGPATISASADQVMTAEFDTSLLSIQVDNATALTAANTNAFGASANIFIGKTRTSGLFFGGRFYGGFVINKLLTTNKASAKTYLGAKAGLTV